MAAGKTSLLLRIETNTGFWDWVGMQSLEFLTDDYTPDEPEIPDEPGNDDPVTPDEPGNDDPVTPDEPTEDDDTDAPATGDTWPYAAVAVLMVAVAAAFALRKKQTN